MSYTRPDHDAADATWAGAPAYTRPDHDAADASWLTSVAGSGSGEIDIAGSGSGAHGVSGAGAGEIDTTGAGAGTTGTPAVVGIGSGEVDVTGDGAGAHGVRGAGEGLVDVEGDGSGLHGVRGTGAGLIEVTGESEGTHLRYELRGEVRLGGVLVNRRVRAYRRDTGAMAGEADTVAGRFRVPAGVGAAREHYVVPIDLAEDATDWRPPMANRLVSVLASDTA